MKRCRFLDRLLRARHADVVHRPDPDLITADEFISPRHGYAMSFRDFLPHISRVLDQLGLSLQARTNFIK